MNALINWKKVERYATNYVDHKDQARALLTESLGFEPPIQLSIDLEVSIRKTLSDINDGQNKQKALKSKLNFYTDLIKKRISKHTSEYNHLLNK